ncbi:hypothetical protein [Ruminococcus sp. FC2018]|uniref:hypothetical protein n=1 Tax=Ruminococcus sp. FC2018 TaxID=1410617 RepID=UPI00048CDC70|nr:hypothetical protein [Ruminococcus sp. FC2018]
MFTTIIGIVLMIVLVLLAIFAMFKELRKDSRIKADKQKYNADVEEFRSQFTDEELDKMSRKYDKQSVISNFLSIFPF